ncbi:MAG TPA: HPF/RaiA family ribosome-associated protein [Gemmatimonadales bacterium]|nr:HPF/RaiA family ribosome-associated protein [Gemmatimonadales bacterium]
MDIIITARHGEVPEALRLRAEQVVTRLARLAHRPTAANVTFDTARQRALAELRLTAARGVLYVASSEAADHRTALDRVASKLRRQLDKDSTSPRRAGRARR